MAVLFLSFSPVFSVNNLTHELPHLAWWNFGRACTWTTSRRLLNIKVIGHSSRSHGFFVHFLFAWYPQAVLSLEWGSVCINRNNVMHFVDCDLCQRDYEGMRNCPKHSSKAVIEYYMVNYLLITFCWGVYKNGRNELNWTDLPVRSLCTVRATQLNLRFTFCQGWKKSWCKKIKIRFFLI